MLFTIERYLSNDMLRKFNNSEYGAMYAYNSEISQGNISDSAIRESISYSSYKFLIPGEDSYQCVRCGKCCYLTHINGQKLDPEVCPYLDNNSCSNYEERFTACRVFPFHLIDHLGTDYLLINRLCSGLGHGEIIKRQMYREYISKLNKLYENADNIRLNFNVSISSAMGLVKKYKNDDRFSDAFFTPRKTL